MKLNLKSNSLRDTLALVTKVTGAKHAMFVIEDQDIYITATDNGKSIKWLVQGSVEEKPKSKDDSGFGFNIFTVSNLASGREDLSIELDKSTIKFYSKSKNSKLKGEFQSIPFEDIKVIQESGDKIELSAREMSVLSDSINKVSLSNQFGTEVLNLFVNINKNGLFTTVYDIHHLAFLHNPSVHTKKDIAFSIPLPLFDLVRSVITDTDYTLQIGNNFISATGVGFELSVPTVQGLGQQSFDQAHSLINSLALGKETVEISIEDLRSTLDSLSAVDDGTSPITISDSKGKTKFSIKSSYGSASEIVKSKCLVKESYVMSPALLNDILRVYPTDEVKINFSKNQAVMRAETKEYRVTYVCVLR